VWSKEAAPLAAKKKKKKGRPRVRRGRKKGGESKVGQRPHVLWGTLGEGKKKKRKGPCPVLFRRKREEKGKKKRKGRTAGEGEKLSLVPKVDGRKGEKVTIGEKKGAGLSNVGKGDPPFFLAGVARKGKKKGDRWCFPEKRKGGRKKKGGIRVSQREDGF